MSYITSKLAIKREAAKLVAATPANLHAGLRANHSSGYYVSAYQEALSKAVIEELNKQAVTKPIKVTWKKARSRTMQAMLRSQGE